MFLTPPSSLLLYIPGDELQSDASALGNLLLVGFILLHSWETAGAVECGTVLGNIEYCLEILLSVLIEVDSVINGPTVVEGMQRVIC